MRHLRESWHKFWTMRRGWKDYALLLDYACSQEDEDDTLCSDSGTEGRLNKAALRRLATESASCFAAHGVQLGACRFRRFWFKIQHPVCQVTLINTSDSVGAFLGAKASFQGLWLCLI